MPETYKEEAAAVRRAIQRMNNGGKHWTKGYYRVKGKDRVMSYCIVGGLEEEGVDSYDVHRILEDVARELYPDKCEHMGDITKFNDHPDTKWGHVKRVLQNTAKRLEKMPKESQG